MPHRKNLNKLKINKKNEPKKSKLSLYGHSINLFMSLLQMP